MSTIDEAVSDTSRRITRHTLATRLNHWLMAASMFVLLGTAFLPILGIKFSWVTAHWIAGLVFTASVIFHIGYVLIRQDWRSMQITLREYPDLLRSLSGSLEKLRVKPGKYWVLQKVYHHVISLFSFVAIVTGILMLFKIDLPIWERDPYILSDDTWGIVYVLHDYSGLLFIPMIMMHIYFAIRPEKLFYTRSMILGWITREEFQAHHDSEAWEVAESEVNWDGGNG